MVLGVNFRNSDFWLKSWDIPFVLLHVHPPTTRKRSKRFTSLFRSCQPSVYHTKMGEFRKVPFPAAPQANLPACFSHCPFDAEREAGKL